MYFDSYCDFFTNYLKHVTNFFCLFQIFSMHVGFPYLYIVDSLLKVHEGEEHRYEHSFDISIKSFIVRRYSSPFWKPAVSPINSNRTYCLISLLLFSLAICTRLEAGLSVYNIVTYYDGLSYVIMTVESFQSFGTFPSIIHLFISCIIISRIFVPFLW